jgi:replicative DNA helicase
MLLHHERKAANGSRRVHSLDDVYGSTWLTSGLGSVIVLECEPGDPTAELRHLKQPAEPVGPLTLGHDHTAGVTALFDDRPDLLSF